MTMKDPALHIARPNPSARVRLVCFPHAGGGATAYQNWARQFPPAVEVCAVQLPGRESRFREGPPRRLGALVESLAESLQALTDRPAAFFGHSMGALLAYEVTRLLRRWQAPLPNHLFLSAHGAPHLPRRRQLHQLPDAQLVSELQAVGGIQAQVAGHNELTQLMLPIIRADLTLVETHAHVPEEPLDVPITALCGAWDPWVSAAEMEGWRQHTTGPFSLRVLPGDHFYLRSNTGVLVSILSHTIA
jgi:medium-chain acyl-[acyl-carrier-protein] hydrolase